ncbi:hypothetical protein MSPP1_002129 [Malassezia sp. CBS 17886]|nr:hypothetical protein MSPP1_002129 [Malassezia sp. CBS 17886]
MDSTALRPGGGAPAPGAVGDLVSGLRAGVGDLLRSDAQAGGGTLHPLCAATATRLGAFQPPARGAPAPCLSPAAWTAAMDKIDASMQHLRSTLALARYSSECNGVHNAAAPAEDSSVAPLLQELSAQSADSACLLRVLYAPFPPGPYVLPPQLWAGMLAGEEGPGTPASGDGALSRSHSVALLDSLTHALLQLASDMHLECFLERIDDGDVPESLARDAPAGPAVDGADAAPSPPARAWLGAADPPPAAALQKTHTLTCGGRIVVLDIEMGIVPHANAVLPHVAVNLSYAHATSHEDYASADAERGLAPWMGSLLQQLANVLCGAPVDERILQGCWLAPRSGSLSAAEELRRTPYAQAACLWACFAESLAGLVRLDVLSATSQHPDNTLFHAMTRLGAAAELVTHTECSRLLGAADALPYPVPPDARLRLLQEHPRVVRALLCSGHGIAFQHLYAPYMSMLFYAPPASVPTDDAYSPVNDAFARGIRASIHMDRLAVPMHPVRLPPLAGVDARVAGEAAFSLDLTSLPATPSGTLHRIVFVAHIDPPVALPHHAARRLWSCTGLDAWRAADDAHGTAAVPRRAHASFVQRSFAEPRVSSFRVVPGSAEDDECIISAVPFTSLVQLYAALEILRTYARWRELLRRAGRAKELDVPAMTMQFAQPTRHDAASVLQLSFPVGDAMGTFAMVSATIAPAAGEFCWAITARAHFVAPADAQPRTLAADAAAAVSLAEQLTHTADLARVVDGLRHWALR